VKLIKSPNKDAADNETLRVLTRHVDALIELQQFLLRRGNAGKVLNHLAAVQADLDSAYYDIVSKS